MSSETVTAIRVEGVGKKYRLGAAQNSHATLREALTRGAATAARRLRSPLGGGRPTQVPEIWALRDVSFDVRQGEIVGIIGNNGAGKSTLLKVLSRIVEPTTGTAVIRGRLGSLLEVGTGFHPELTGRENIYLNGAILGMRNADIASKFDEIVEFSEVAKFIDTPVKRYSSGMYLRLAFSVAAHLEPEILVLDEVLAVGDAAFQKKCLGKMGDVAHAGRTVIFVSHNMDAVQRLCSRAIMLERGRISADGAVADVVGRYLSSGVKESAPDEWMDVSQLPRSGSGQARFLAVRYASEGGAYHPHPHPYGSLTVEIEVVADSALLTDSIGAVIWSSQGVKLVNADSITNGQAVRLEPGRNRVQVKIEELYLNPGTYRLGLWMASSLGVVFDYVEAALTFDVVEAVSLGLGMTPKKNGLVPCRFSVERVAAADSVEAGA